MSKTPKAGARRGRYLCRPVSVGLHAHAANLVAPLASPPGGLARLSPLDLAPVQFAQLLRVVEEAGDALLPPAQVVALALGHESLRHVPVVLAQHLARPRKRGSETEAPQALKVDAVALRFGQQALGGFHRLVGVPPPRIVALAVDEGRLVPRPPGVQHLAATLQPGRKSGAVLPDVPTRALHRAKRVDHAADLRSGLIGHVRIVAGGGIHLPVQRLVPGGVNDVDALLPCVVHLQVPELPEALPALQRRPRAGFDRGLPLALRQAPVPVVDAPQPPEQPARPRAVVPGVGRTGSAPMSGAVSGANLRRGQLTPQPAPLARLPFGLRKLPVVRTLKRIAEVLRRRRHHDPHEVARWLGRVVNGWLNYYAVPTSSRFLRSFTYILKRIWLKALRRRSQHDRFSWQRLQALVDRYWPKPWIRHPWPEQRFDVKYPR